MDLAQADEEREEREHEIDVYKRQAYDVSKESLKNNIGLKFAFRSTDINEIKQTLELSLIHILPRKE